MIKKLLASNKNLYQLIEPYRILLLIGEVGAGKTTFVRNYLKSELVQSPTFTFLNVYHIEGKVFHHFDLYHSSSINEIIESIENPEVDKIFIEWPNDPLINLCKTDSCIINFNV